MRQGKTEIGVLKSYFILMKGLESEGNRPHEKALKVLQGYFAVDVVQRSQKSGSRFESQVFESGLNIFIINPLASLGND